MIEAIGYMLIGAFFALIIPFLQSLAEVMLKDKSNE